DLAKAPPLSLGSTVMPPLRSSTLVSFSVIAAAGSAADRMVAPCGADERCSRPIGIQTIFSLVSSGLELIHSAAQCGQVASKNTYTVFAAITAPIVKPLPLAASS